MKLWRDIESVGKHVDQCAVSVGNFDGVHRGHQEIGRTLIKFSQQHNIPSVVVIFESHPATVLHNRKIDVLCTPEQRAQVFKDLGVDHCVLLPFTKDFGDLSVQSFVQLLTEKLNMRYLVMGPTTHMGKNREGTPLFLKDLEKIMDFQVIVALPVYVENVLVSSTRIRQELLRGNVDNVFYLLGRYFSLSGTVITGNSLGRSMGFPTANLLVKNRMVPKHGVYATFVYVEDSCYQAVTNIGVRPTISDESTEVIETHLFDFNSNLVGKIIRIEWVTRIRDEQKFVSLDQLKSQIEKDCQYSKKYLSEIRKNSVSFETKVNIFCQKSCNHLKNKQKSV